MRISRAIFTALAACGVASAVEFTCGSTDPPLSLLEVAADMQDNDDALLDSRAPLVIDTHVHVVTTLFKTGKYTSKQIDQEVSHPVALGEMPSGAKAEIFLKIDRLHEQSIWARRNLLQTQEFGLHNE